MLTEIVISGFGGQGGLFAGKCIAHAAMLSGMEVSWLPSYGPEMRGGTANCSVCISDTQIGSPLVNEPDILIAMNTPSFDRFAHTVKSGGYIFTDSSITDRICDRDDISVNYVSASQLAQENGLAGMSNIVFLGYVLKNCADRLMGVNLKTLSETFKTIIPKSKSGLADKNIQALMLGMSS